MSAVSIIAVALAAATSAPVDDPDTDLEPGLAAAEASDTTAETDLPPPRVRQTVVGGSVGATFLTEPSLAAHVGVWLRGNGSGPFQYRGDLAVDVMPPGPGPAGVLSADVAALFVHAIDHDVELAIGGGPAGGAVAHAGRVDGFFGIVGIASGTVDVVPGFAVGLELRGLAGVMVPSAAPLLASSLSLTTAWRL